MRKILKRAVFSSFVVLVAFGAVRSQTANPQPPDLTRQPTLYVVGYAHLDTEWRWDYTTTIREYLPKTMRVNFDLIEKYPHYIFNFSGANRYRMIREYFPEGYERVKRLVAAGRWFPSGSSMEENDVNAPSAESTIRQILYGTQYFRREFGRTSAEYMLPDCFGFPASLPSILAHCGIKGFSTQKLSSSWQPAARVGGPNSPEQTPDGIPFNIGVWEGPDGKSVIAALNPGSYGGSVTHDLSASPPPPPPAPEGQPARRGPLDWPARIQLNGRVTGLFADYMYHGTGDTGGSPAESSVKLVEAIVTKSKTVLPPANTPRRQPGQAPVPPPPPGPEIQVGLGPVNVVSATSEQMFLDLKPDQTSRLPRYKGDLELINHSAGSITSQAYMKRWNRHNEVLADNAERASIVAEWLGGRSYPLKRLNDAWTLVMGGQFHDIIPGTSIPMAYEYSWNDEVLALNQFAGVLTGASEAVASVLDTRGQGTALIVFNPLNIPREDIVEAEVDFPGGAPKAVRVFGPEGKEVPAQWSRGKVIFPAKTPSVGFAVFDVRVSESSPPSGLKATESSLENARYRITLNPAGDIAEIFDKSLKKQLLSAPARLEIKTDKPVDWPAWNMDWIDQQRPPRAYVAGPAKIRVVENGPARVAVEIVRETEGSKFVQTIRLSAGDGGNRIEFGNVVDWKTAESHLKAVFPLSAANRLATYNWDIGTIERPNNDERQFEVASHQWIDLTDQSGTFGSTILSDCKIASDKPDDQTLRLTLLRTPGIGTGNGRSYSDQASQDWGRHEFLYGFAGHAGDFRKGETDWQGLRLNQPLVAFSSPSHSGALGKSFSLLSLNTSRVRILALKKAEQSDEVVVRLVEMNGRPAKGVRIQFASPLSAAREINGAEMPVGDMALTNGGLVCDLTPFMVRSFAVKLGLAPAKAAPPRSLPVALPYDQSVASRDGVIPTGGFDANGRSLPAEMLEGEIAFDGITFALASAEKRNAVVTRGQTIALPTGKFNRLYILAAAAGGDQPAAFKIGDQTVDLTIQDWGGYIGQWDNRIWTTRQEPVPARPGEPITPAASPQPPPRMRTVAEFAGLRPGFIKRAPVAWFASHRHAQDGTNEPYSYAYLFAYVIDLPAGVTALTLPNNERIRVLAVTAAAAGERARPAHPFYDTLAR